MYWTLALRHVLVRPWRALLVFGGFGIGVAVMIVLLSVGDAMLDQSRDVSLVAGGELVALPEGIDVEAMRTGGLTGMFFGINAAQFVAREMIGGPRFGAMVTGVAPLVDQKVIELHARDTTWTIRAGGEIPSAAVRAGTAVRVISGTWSDNADDRNWIAPDNQHALDQADHFHTAVVGDSTWAEWHYFNIVVSANEWWYITLLVAGDPATERSGGQVLVTHRRPDGSYQRFVASAPRNAIRIDTASADLIVGTSRVMQRAGVYHVTGSAGEASFDFTLQPTAGFHFPPVELGAENARSGYVVPALVATATGKLCVLGRCTAIRGASAYHDHNWGTWHAVTWEWGAARGSHRALLYGGVIDPGKTRPRAPFFLAVADSLGVAQIYRFDAVEQFGGHAGAQTDGVAAPDSLQIIARRLGDSLIVVVRIVSAAASRSVAAGPDRIFLQMRGEWRASGTVAGQSISDSGTGFFETWRPAARQR